MDMSLVRNVIGDVSLKLTVDRIEGNIVICESEDRKMVDLPIDKFPKGIKSGDVINIVRDNGEEVVSVDTIETEARKREIQSRFNKLFKR